MERGLTGSVSEIKDLDGVCASRKQCKSRSRVFDESVAVKLADLSLHPISGLCVIVCDWENQYGGYVDCLADWQAFEY